MTSTSESGYIDSMRKVLRESCPENTNTNQSKYGRYRNKNS